MAKNLGTLADMPAHYEPFSAASSLPRLDPFKIAHYEAPRSRLFLLDVEGTLATWDQQVGQSNIRTSPQRTINTLVELTAQERNLIYVFGAGRGDVRPFLHTEDV